MNCIIIILKSQFLLIEKIIYVHILILDYNNKEVRKMDDLEYLSLVNDIGYLLLRSNSEIFRVEESIEKLCLAYGFKDIEVFAIPTYYTLSLTLTDGSTYAKSMRSRHNKVNLDTLYEVNNIIRSLCSHQIDLYDARKRIDALKSSANNHLITCSGYMISSFMFTAFFNGEFIDCIIASLIGLALYLCIYFQDLLQINSIAKTLFSSMLIALLALFFQSIGSIQLIDSVIVGTLMLLVPGIAITNSLRDVIGGDYVSGLSRMIEALLIAATIAIGVGIVFMVIGGASL